MPKDFAQQFYNSKLWADTRAYILNRDNCICTRCGKAAEEVHHIIRLNPDNINDKSICVNPDNLISLCRDCHQLEHEHERHTPAEELRGKFVAPKGLVFDAQGYLIQAQTYEELEQERHHTPQVQK